MDDHLIFLFYQINPGDKEHEALKKKKKWRKKKNIYCVHSCLLLDVVQSVIITGQAAVKADA